MSYFPVTPNRSGEILAEGISGSAQMKAQAMSGLGQNIGDALATIGGMYGEIEGMKAKGRAFKDVFKVVGPTMGMDTTQLEAISGGKLRSDMDWYNVSETVSPLMPSLINLQLGKNNNATRQQQMGVQMALPMRRATAAGMQSQAAQGGPTQTAFPSSINPDVIP